MNLNPQHPSDSTVGRGMWKSRYTQTYRERERERDNIYIYIYIYMLPPRTHPERTTHLIQIKLGKQDINTPSCAAGNIGRRSIVVAAAAGVAAVVVVVVVLVV